MTASKLADAVSFIAAAGGTVDFAEGTLRPGYLKPSQSPQLSDGDPVSWTAIYPFSSAPAQHEWGRGTWDATAKTISRTTIEGSVDNGVPGSGFALNFAGPPVVMVTLLAADVVQASELATVATTGDYSDLTGKPTLGTASEDDADAFATAVQGAKADTAVQPGSLAAVATSGEYGDLSGTPTLGSAAAQNTTAFATAAQGGKADTAVQPGDLATVAESGAYSDLTGKPTLGTAAALDVGVAANDVVRLDGSGKLPPVDGSQLTNLPGGGGGITTLAENVTPTSGFTDGYALISSGGKVGEALIRTLITGNLTGYVDSATGSDSNPWPGTSGAPLATLQYAWDFGTANSDGNGNNLTLNCQGAGPYTLLANSGWNGFGEVDIVGDGSAITTITDLALGNELSFVLGCEVAIDSATFTNDSNQYCIASSATGTLVVGGINNDVVIEPAGGFTFAGIGALNDAIIILNESSFSAGNGFLFGCYCQMNGNIQCYSELTMVGTPTFLVFIFCEDQGLFYASGMGVSGSATPGLGGLVATGGTIDLQGFGPENLPGGGGIMCLSGGQQDAPTIVIASPVSGDTVSALNFPGVNLLLTPANTLATLTLNLPELPAVIDDIPYPTDGPTISFTSSQDVTALTVAETDGRMIGTAPTTLLAGITYFMNYNINAAQWHVGKGAGI